MSVSQNVDFKWLSSEVQELHRTGCGEAAAALLASSVPVDAPLSQQLRVCRLGEQLVAEVPEAQRLRVALIGGTTTDHLRRLLGLRLALLGIASEFYEPTFDTLDQDILFADSPLYRFRPDIVWLFTTHRDLRIEDGGDPSPEAAAVRV